MSLFAVLIARRTWVADVARVLAFSVFFLPSLINYRGSRAFLATLLEPIAVLSPLGWAARATVFAGDGDFTRSLWFAAPALLLLMGIAFISMNLLNRILAGEGEDRVAERKTKPLERTQQLRALIEKAAPVHVIKSPGAGPASSRIN